MFIYTLFFTSVISWSLVLARPVLMENHTGDDGDGRTSEPVEGNETDEVDPWNETWPTNEPPRKQLRQPNDGHFSSDSQ